MRKLINLFFIGAIATQVGATDCGQVLRDPGFDLWCGEELCAWKVERGEIKRVPTWHEADSGVELVGPDTAIAQLSPVDSGDGYCRDKPEGGTECTYPADVCIEFSLLANIDDKAVVDLNVDVLNDGTIDHAQRLPIGKWQRLAYKIVVRMPFAGIRFELAKSGTGIAQLANIGAVKARNCEGLPVIDPRPAPLGAPCETGADCASGICGNSTTPPPFDGVIGFLRADTVCVECDLGDFKCSPGFTCGSGEPVTPVRAVPTTCVPVWGKQLGEQCGGHWDCASGICSYNTCSTCSADVPCAGGESCGPAWDTAYGVHSAWVCSPNAHVRQTGEPCATHGDCASSVCLGAERKQCNDGRSCATAAQCPFEDGLKNGPCNTVGIQGGICQ